VKRAAESIGHGAKIALNNGLGVQAGAELADVRLVRRSAVPSSAKPAITKAQLAGSRVRWVLPQVNACPAAADHA
jgi:hypothetical protein